MSNESIMPPDIQEQLVKQRRAQQPSGIGSAAPENRTSRTRAPEESADPPKADKVEEREPTTCKSTFCNQEISEEAAFCSRCGFDQMRGGLLKKLGVEPFSDDDIQDYVFRGYVIREIKVLGKHTATLRSSQAKDLKEIDSFIMNGDWSKADDEPGKGKGKEKQISEFLLRQMNALCLTAMAIQKVDGASIGNTLVERVKWLEERGSAFVDLLAQKVTIFNQALSEHLKKEDTLSGS